MGVFCVARVGVLQYDRTFVRACIAAVLLVLGMTEHRPVHAAPNRALAEVDMFIVTHVTDPAVQAALRAFGEALYKAVQFGSADPNMAVRFSHELARAQACVELKAQASGDPLRVIAWAEQAEQKLWGALENSDARRRYDQFMSTASFMTYANPGRRPCAE